MKDFPDPGGPKRLRCGKKLNRLNIKSRYTAARYQAMAILPWSPYTSIIILLQALIGGIGDLDMTPDAPATETPAEAPQAAKSAKPAAGTKTAEKAAPAPSAPPADPLAAIGL